MFGISWYIYMMYGWGFWVGEIIKPLLFLGWVGRALNTAGLFQMKNNVNHKTKTWDRAGGFV